MLCKQEKIYQCECGYITTNKQSYCGHRGNCKIAHPELLNKNLRFDNWNGIVEIEIFAFSIIESI